jgi:hypothetical protein
MRRQVPSLARTHLGQELGERYQKVVCSAEQIGETIKVETLLEKEKAERLVVETAEQVLQKKQANTKIVGKQTPHHEIVRL